MQLLRLELKGFKSFADKTIVKFSSGMTAVIGPNGSGKSNITDAMKWVLGESNVRNLRGQKAEDIIFSGTEKRKPLGAAEVTLIFDNSDHQLDLDVAEVAITRRIYRTGDSEFLINKRSCRLKDIHMLLADTGLGKDSMAIIGQNRIDAILNSKPEERRVIFEDVAGISRFKLNKEDALRRIANTERNMERIQDVMATIEEQLEPLQEKAEKTKQYMVLSRSKRDYDGALGFHNYKTADRLLTRFENENITYRDEEIELQTSLSTLDAKRHTLQANSVADENQLKTWNTEHSEAMREEERYGGELRLIEEQLKTSTKELTDTELSLNELTATVQGEEQQIQILDKLIGSDEESLRTMAMSVQYLEKDYIKAVAALTEAQQLWQNKQNLSAEQQQQHRDVIAQLEATKAEHNAAVEAIEASRQLQDTLASEIEDVEKQLHHMEQEYTDVETTFTNTGAERQRIVEAIHELRQKVQQQRKDLQSIQSREQKVQGRLELLAQWEEQHEGYVEGTKNILVSTAPWRKEIRGAVGELFTVEERFMVAIETALGGSVNHIIAHTAQAAAEGVKYLKATQGGRITFLPMDSIVGRLLESQALQEPTVLGLGVDCITYPKELQNIFTYLLGRTIIVETMEAAISLQKKYKQQLRIVTLSGEQFQPGGSLTGGITKRKRSSLLSRKEEMTRLEQDLQGLSSDMAQGKTKLSADESALEGLQQDQVKADEAHQHWNLLFMAQQTKADNVKQQRDRKVRVLTEEQEKEKSKLALCQTLEEQQRNLEATLEALTKDLDGDSDSSSQMGAITKLQQQQQMAYETFATARFEEEQIKRNLEERKGQKAERTDKIQSIQSKLGPLKESLIALKERCTVTIPSEQERISTVLKEVQEKVIRLGALRDELYNKTDSSRTEMESILSEQDVLHKRYKLVQSRLVDMESKLTRYRMDCERIVQELSELGFTLNEAGEIHLPGAVNDWKDEQARLLAAIAELGSVNPNAIAEYEETEERFQFLQTQQADLVTAKEQLQSVIDEMDKAMSTQLIDVLKIVGEGFQNVFSKLFGGGTAQIVLTTPDDILSSGIDFYIQPPGKKRQQLTLLSGGERALTVIALLFAFLDYRPAPFCVLDEVDAALDEANVERFSHYLGQVNGDTQFIVVSHRKKTMEAAEVLQGVTMVERGVSRLLTVAFEDVKEDLS